MDNIIIEVAKQVPNLGALVILVWFFLSHTAKRDEVLRDLHKEHLDERYQSRLVIKENTDSNKELIRVIQSAKQNHQHKQ